jgi:hypothetical protein
LSRGIRKVTSFSPLKKVANSKVVSSGFFDAVNNKLLFIGCFFMIDGLGNLAGLLADDHVRNVK